MGNHPSAVADDGFSPVHQQSYTVRGNLHAQSVTASTINARLIVARRITCRKAQVSSKEPLHPSQYPQPPGPQRAVAAHTINADAVFADEVNVKTLRAYDVRVGAEAPDAQWRCKRIEWLDRNAVDWDGREDDESDASSSDDDERELSRDLDRQNRKRLTQFGAAGALGLALGGAALAYSHHQKSEKEKKERERWEQQQHQHQHQQQHGYQKPLADYYGNPMPDPHRPSPPHHPQQQQQQHHHPAPGNFHLSSQHIRLEGAAQLVAECGCGGGDGRVQTSRLDLDDRLTNDDGAFRWVAPGQTGAFSASARGVHLVDGGRALRAELRCVDGRWVGRTVRLDERVTNEWGTLKVVV